MTNENYDNNDIENENDVEENLDSEGWEDQEEMDYKTLLEEANAKIAKLEPYEGRFKKTAKELNEMKKKNPKDTGDVSEQVSKQVQEEMFYANNPVAKEYKEEIKEVQANTGMLPEDALTFYLAKNKPELLGKKTSSVWVDGVSKPVEGEKDVKDMTYDDLFPNEKKW